MPRPIRLDHPGARHHVFNRFSDRERLFDRPGSRALFLQILADLPDRHGVAVHGYALMSNHYHLMLEVPRGNLSRTMQHVGSTFTQRFHAHHGGDGPVFRGRFRNEIVDSDTYWMQLLVYLHLNPVRAGVVAEPSHSDWTSHRAYTGHTTPPAWLTVRELLAHFGSARELEAQTTTALPTGGMLPDAQAPAPPITTVRPSPPTQTATAALAQVCALLEEVPVSTAGGPTPHTGRRLSAWWLWRSTDLTLVEIGEVLGVSRTRARQLAIAFQGQARTDRVAAALMHRLLFPSRLRQAS